MTIKKRISQIGFACLILILLLYLVPESTYAARDANVASYSLVAPETPLCFKWAGGTCLNQLTWSYPSSGTNLTISTYSGSTTQWYQMIEIVNNGNVGHGYATWNNATVSINRRRTSTPYVNVITTTSNTFGDADVRYGCDYDLINGVNHYIGTDNLTLTGFSCIGEQREAADAGYYIWWIDRIPSTPWEWLRYNAYTNVKNDFCGCRCVNEVWYYDP